MSRLAGKRSKQKVTKETKVPFYPSLEVLRHLRCLLLNKIPAARPPFDSLTASLVAPYLSVLSVRSVVKLFWLFLAKFLESGIGKTASAGRENGVQKSGVQTADY